ncbi:MAG: P-type Cu+ transporter [Geotoga sp.]|nr:P-type Cu+ transporter [Geotoga sp.]
MNEDYKINFSVEGMTCAGCVRNVERALKKIEEVKYVSINLATERAFLISSKEIPFEQIERQIKNVGYKAVKKRISNDVLEEKYKKSKNNLIIASAITIPLMILMVLNMFGITIPFFHYIELVFSSIVLFYSGRKTLKGAYIAVSHGHTNMDTLVSLGGISAWITNLLAITSFDILSFGTLAAMLINLHILGRFIESKLKRNASKEIKNLLELQSNYAFVETEGNEQIEVPVDSVKKGDIIVVKKGSKIPLDGEIIYGGASINESMVTGEPVPVYKEKGEEVIGGTINENGMIKVKVEKVGEDTFLSQMIKLIEESQSAKIPIQAFADRITNYFIPIVFGLAVFSALFWYFNFENLAGYQEFLSNNLFWIKDEINVLSQSIFVFVATLVIACPCALGLAIPMALVSGSGVAAKKGLIIRNGSAIQTSKDIDTILFDKTGTITEGNPKVVYHNIKEDVFSVIASLEEYSNHPLANAVIKYSKENNLYKKIKFDNIEEITSKGISGVYNNDKYFVGKPENSENYRDILNGKNTIIEVTKNDEKLGIISIEDPIKSDAVDTIKKLKEMGLTTYILTGDNKVTAQKVAEIVGVDYYEAEMKPKDKVDIVNKLKMQGKKVCMVGDGINDAAALKAADLSLAIGTGTDLAIESADIVSIKGDIQKIVDSIDISKVTFSKIKQNLFWAFAYNLIAIPLAMSGALHPAIAEIAMIFSSINVIINSNSIKNKF